MDRITATFLLALTVAAFAAPAQADMYTWTDRAGNAHISDRPDDPSAKRMNQEDLSPMFESEQAPGAAVVPQKTFLPGAITVKGQLLFDGRPFSECTTAPAVFRIYSQELKQWITPDYTYDSRSGTFRLNNIAQGTYSGDIAVDANRSNPDLYAGDYKGRLFFSATRALTAPVTVNMERILHLTKPEDNSLPFADWGAVCSNRIEFVTPVAFAWEPMGKDVIYSYSIVRTICSPFEFKEPVAADKTTGSGLVLDLPPNSDGEFYTLRLEARKNDKPIGSLMTHGTNGWGWDYRFRVLPKRGPTRLINPRS